MISAMALSHSWVPSMEVDMQMTFMSPFVNRWRYTATAMGPSSGSPPPEYPKSIMTTEPGGRASIVWCHFLTLAEMGTGRPKGKSMGITKTTKSMP